MGTVAEETPIVSRRRQAASWMADAVSVAVTGERGGNVRRNLLYMTVGVSLVGVSYTIIFLVVGLLALILLALGDVPQ